MVHNMYKSKRQLSDADTLELLKKGDHGTWPSRGRRIPRMPPRSTTSWWGTSSTSTPAPTYKIECLQRDPKCCFTAILSTEIIPSKITASFESVILTGQAVFVEDPAEKRTVMENFVTQKHPGYEELGFRMIEKQLDKTAVIRIDPSP